MSVSAPVCVCLLIPALCSNGCIQCRSLGKINEEGDVYYNEKFEVFLRKIPRKVSPNVQSQQEGNKMMCCEKEMN